MIDLILTNISLHFQKKLQVAKTRLHDYHKMMSIFFKVYLTKLKTGVINYRC